MGVKRSKRSSGPVQAKKRLSAQNRRASFDVAVQETYEAGLVLTGDEIKSIRADRMQLTGSYVRIISDEPVVVGLHLSLAKEPDRIRKLLLHAKEVEAIRGALQAGGLTAVPVRLYLKRGWAKLEIGLGRGRKRYDKRELLKQRDLERQQRRLA